MSNVAGELAQLAELRDKGVLTDAEFSQQKAALLNQASAPPPNVAAYEPAMPARSSAMPIMVVVLVLVVVAGGAFAAFQMGWFGRSASAMSTTSQTSQTSQAPLTSTAMMGGGASPAAGSSMPTGAMANAGAGGIPVSGRWTASPADRSVCDELADIVFTNSSIAEYKPDGQLGESHPAYYSDVTPTSFSISEEAGGRVFATAQLTSPTTLTLTSVENRPGDKCTLTKQ